MSAHPGPRNGSSLAADADMRVPVVDVDRVSICYPGTRAVDGLSFTVRPREFVSIVGPSGCGKTTILNAILGIADPTATITGSVKVAAKRIGYVSQRDSLLPWRTVLRNVEFALQLEGVSRRERMETSAAVIEKLGLAHFIHAYPHQLSGGMRQKVALARMLAYSPELVVMDEPFAAVDAHTKLMLQRELMTVWGQMDATVLFITHDLEEAITLSDRVLIFSARPARVEVHQHVALTRPRDPLQLRGDKDFHAIYAQVWDILRAQVEAQHLTAGQ